MTKEPAGPAEARESGDTDPRRPPEISIDAIHSHAPASGWLPVYFAFLAGAPIGPWLNRLSLPPPERALAAPQNDPSRERLPVAQRSGGAQHETPRRVE